MKQLMMSGKIIVSYLDDNDPSFRETLITPADLFLEDNLKCQLVFNISFPKSNFHKHIETYLWLDYEEFPIFKSWNDYGVKLSPDNLLIQFCLYDQNDDYNFFGVARLEGEIPSIIPDNAIYDLSEFRNPQKI